MSLGKYLANCDALWKELRSLLSDDDIEELDAEITAMGDDGWKKWKDDNAESIVTFSISTPKQREKVKDRKTLKRLIFASLQRCTGGVHLLLALKDHGIEEPFHSSYRDMLDSAAAAYDDMISKPFPWIPTDLYHWGAFSPLEQAEIEVRRAVEAQKVKPK